MQDLYLKIDDFINKEQYEKLKEPETSLNTIEYYLNQIKDQPLNQYHLRLNYQKLIFSNFDDGQILADYCSKLAEKLNSEFETALYFLNLANFYRRFFKNDQAESFYLKAIDFANKSNDLDLLNKISLQYAIMLCRAEKFIDAYKIMMNLINAKISQDEKLFFMTLYSWLSFIEASFLNYDKSIEYTLRSINLCLAIKNYPAYAVNNNSLGLTYFDLGKYDLALEAFLSAEKIAMEYKNYELLSDVLHNIGLVYKNLSDSENALQFFFQSLEYRKKTSNFSNQAITFSAIGHIYMDNEDLKNAEIFFNKSLNLRIKYKLDRNINQSKLEVCNLLIEKKRYKKAEQMINQIIKIEDKHEILAYAYYLLTRISEKRKDFKSALLYSNKNLEEKNLIINNENIQKIHITKNKYDLELLKQESQEKILLEKKNTALDLAKKTKEHLEQPVKAIRNEIQILSNELTDLNLFDSHAQYIKKIDNAVDRIEEILNMFETNDKISFKDYIDLIEMVEFEK
jgi:tetratricopeptide (TPR) repeat protein